MRLPVPAVLLGLMLSGALDAHNVYVVSKAEDLRFVPLKQPFLEIRKRMEGKVELADRVRRAAFDKVARDWGLPPADKKDLSLGCVVRAAPGSPSSIVLVLKGELDSQRLLAKMKETYVKSLQKRGLTPAPQDVEVDGHPAVRLPYTERAGVYTLVPMGKIFVAASTPTSDQSLLDEVMAVLKEPDKLQDPAAGKVALALKLKMTPGEQGKVQTFKVKSVSSAVGKLRDQFRKLHERLRPEGAQEEDLKSLDERMNEQLLKATDFDLSMAYQAGPTEDEDMYSAVYAMNYPGEEEAQKMKELLLEKSLFFRENAVSDRIGAALDAVNVDAQGNQVHLKVDLDTREKQYDAMFSYVAFLLSFSSANKYLGIGK